MTYRFGRFGGLGRLVNRSGFAFILVALGLVGTAKPADALDRLCDPANENCRTILINYIRQETVGIDVGFWFMEDARYTTELINRFKAGVPVRVLMDTRANATNQYNAERLAELQAAGIPMRRKTTSGIMHYKMMLFAGQQVVEFSGANFSADAWVYTTAPYTNYVDEAIYFTDDASIVQSFMSRFDDLWTNTTSYTSYANITNAQVARNYPTYTKDPALNFPPSESYASRAIKRYNAETQKIDVIMYRITDRRHTDAIIAAKNRGVQVRLISEPQQYREPSRLWVAWNIDRLYMAGIPIKMRAHAGLNHQKLVLLYNQGMSIFGSSNWTSPSDQSQEEHNYFAQKPAMFQWFVDHFERKWNNTAGVTENSDFVPLPPDKPVHQAPANGAIDVTTSSVQFQWYGGPWAHKYDVLLGTDPNNLQPVMLDQELGPSESATEFQSFTATNLLPGTTYYWRVVSKTMANMSRQGDVWSFTTAGTAPPPPSNGSSGAGDIVLYGADAQITGTNWSLVGDASAAGGKRLYNKNNGAAKVTAASASPANYVELTFEAVAGQPYHFWMRGKADSNVYTNDSVFVQFSNATTSNGTPIYRIGTTSSAEYNLEECSGCGISGWGWQDNGWGSGVLGPALYFDATGPQTLRIQNREDGLSIDQIVLSPSTFLNSSPGALKNDTTIFAATQGPSAGGGTAPPPTPTASTALPASWAHLDIGAVGPQGDSSYDSGAAVYTVKGAGADVWGTADAFHFAYTTLDGDGTITARVASTTNNHAWVKAGVMIRASLDANAAHGFMLVSAGKGLAFQRRAHTGGTSASSAGAMAAAPYWVRVERSGTTVNAYQSVDGANWVLVGTDTIALGASAYVGLAVSSHTTTSLATATFDNVTVSSTGSEG